MPYSRSGEVSLDVTVEQQRASCPTTHSTNHLFRDSDRSCRRVFRRHQSKMSEMLRLAHLDAVGVGMTVHNLGDDIVTTPGRSRRGYDSGTTGR